MRHLLTIAAALVATAGVAGAEPAPAVRVPPAPRVIDVPTARLQPSGRVFLSGGAFVIPDRTPFVAVTLGLGGLADVDLELTDQAAVCRDCSPEDPVPSSIALMTAAFKMGLEEGRLHRWQPALALGLRAPIRGRTVDFTELPGIEHDIRAARLFLAASQHAGPVDLHLGVEVWDAESDAGGTSSQLNDGPLAERVRPLAGMEWNPSIYPRTRLLADIGWAPVFEDGEVELRWLFGWGVRYQAVSWGSIELDVRHREEGGLDDTEVTVRLNGVLDLWNRAEGQQSRP